MRKILREFDDVKKRITELRGQSVLMNINRGRKKIDTISATIKDIYPSVFTIKTQDEKLQTFSYFDVLCGDVELII